MKALIKTVFKVLLGLIVLGCLIILGLSYFADPARLKPYVIRYMSEHYQRNLEMGDIHWRVFPKIGLSIDDIVLSDSPAFNSGKFASIKNVSVFLDTLSALHGKIDIQTIELKDLSSNLKTNANGVNNWDDLAKTPKSEKAAKNTEANPEKDDFAKDIEISIDHIEVKNANFSYADARTGASYKISDFSFEGNDIGLDKEFPARLKMKIASASPKMMTDFDIKAKINVPKTGTFNTKVVQMVGDMSIPQIQAQGLKVTNINAPFSLKKGVLSLSSIRAQLYGGQLKGDLNVDMNPQPQAVALKYNLQGAQMAAFLKDLNGSSRFTGTLSTQGQFNLKLFPSEKDLKKSLNGNANINLRNGQLKGVDLAYFYALGSNLVNPKKPVPVRANTGKTDFLVTDAKIVVKNGVLTNDNFMLFNEGIYGAGAGTVNFVSNQINYRFKIQGAKPGANGQYDPVGQVIPLQITGSTANPNIALDVAAVTSSVIEQVVTERLDKATGGSGIGSKLLQSIQGN